MYDIKGIDDGFTLPTSIVLMLLFFYTTCNKLRQVLVHMDGIQCGGCIR